ncbi:Potassium channel regulatory protein [Holothuria leucospilota]|uniref:Potassium channel regulatory protein n=1 Tax=Holothuria leucospilota TaxID=206669 RepID=A0A9Q1C774_HOLLE|nr:Potassium channel regulatory protein [Holothuria leucospilota]
MANKDTSSGVVNINVGGTKYTVYKKTLQDYGESKLMTKLYLAEADKQEKDKDVNIFFDRDGDLFKYILRYMQQKELHLPEGYNDIDALVKEAQYYSVKGLPDELEKYKKKSEAVILVEVLYEEHYFIHCTLGTYKSSTFLTFFTAKQGSYIQLGRQEIQIEDFILDCGDLDDNGQVCVKVTCTLSQLIMTLATQGFENKGQFNGFTLWKR